MFTDTQEVSGAMKQLFAAFFLTAFSLLAQAQNPGLPDFTELVEKQGAEAPASYLQDVLAGLGAVVEDVALPPRRPLDAATWTILLAEGFAIHQHDLRTRPHLYGRTVRERLTTGAFVTGSDLVQAHRLRRVLTTQMTEALRPYDAVICSPMSGPPPPLSDVDDRPWRRQPPITAPVSLAIWSSEGAIIRQGPHHSAQKSTSTTPLAVVASKLSLFNATGLALAAKGRRARDVRRVRNGVFMVMVWTIGRVSRPNISKKCRDFRVDQWRMPRCLIFWRKVNREMPSQRAA